MANVYASGSGMLHDTRVWGLAFSVSMYTMPMDRWAAPAHPNFLELDHCSALVLKGIKRSDTAEP